MVAYTKVQLSLCHAHCIGRGVVRNTRQSGPPIASSVAQVTYKKSLSAKVYDLLKPHYIT
jgi:hypothetical protein